MPTFKQLKSIIADAWTGATRKSALRSWRLRYPEQLTQMSLAGEPVPYLAAAVLAVNQIGE